MTDALTAGRSPSIGRAALLTALLTLTAAAPAAAAVVGPAAPAGMCRDADVCPCPQEELDKLQRLVGRLRGLREAYEAIEGDYTCAQRDRQRAGAALTGCGGPEATSPSNWCNGGAWRDFSSATAGVLAQKEGLNQLWSIGLTVIDVGTDSGSVTTWAGAVHETVSIPGFLDAGERRVWEEAVAYAQEYLERTGDVDGARRMYEKGAADAIAGRATAEQALKWIGAGLAVYEFGTAVKGLTDNLADWGVAWREEKGLNKELERIQARIEETLAEIAAIRAACPNAPTGGGAAAAGGQASPGCPDPAGAGVANAAPAANAAPGGGTSSEAAGDAFLRRAEAARRHLDAIGTVTDRLARRMATRLVPRIGLFLVDGLWLRADPRLVRAIGQAALPEIKHAADEMARLADLSRAAERALEP